MPAPQRVHVTHTYRSDPATVFEALSEHENLGPIMGCAITRVSDGETSRNGPGTTRQLKIGPLPPIEETVTAADPNSLIEYRITKGGKPLRGHWGVQRLTPTADGGTELDYRIGFDAPVPGVASLVGKAITRQLSKGLPRLVP
jgi:uncharacterized protein YndB with AHSA1/START domain